MAAGPGWRVAWLLLRWAEELGFEVGDAPVLDPQVRPRGFEPLVQGPVVGGELPYSLFEGGVLGGDALDGLLRPLGFQVPDLAEEFADPGALLDDLGVGGFQRVFGVEGAFPPGRFLPGVLSGPIAGLPEAAGLGGGGHRGSGFGVAVEKGAGDARPPADCGDGDPRLLTAHPGECVVNASECGLGAAAARRESGCGLRLVPARGSGAHCGPRAGTAVAGSARA